MKKQNLLGIFLFAIGVLLTLGFAKYFNFSSAVYFGENIARTLIFSLLLLIALIATPYRKSIGIVLVIGSTWLACSIYSSVEIYKSGSESKKLAKIAVQLFDDFSSNKEIKNTIKPNNLTLIELFQNYMANVQKIRNEYANELNKGNLTQILTPEYIMNEDHLIASEKKLDILLSNIPKYKERLLIELLNFEKTLSSRKDIESTKALNGFNKTKKDGVVLLEKYYENQKNIVSSMKKIVIQAKRLVGSLSLKNEQLIFPSQEELDIYNKELVRINELAIEEQEIIKYQQGKTAESIENLRN